ncbi:3-oxoacyl-[acyl-carrier-protein] reductase FabG [Geodia barretti]|uniref:3-oxoacyl-[acyl-carrier-protein] reductase FabG n=1 Tax=Geodia barretti TaxID=519541 RepID=A0AA35WPZ5_GEOBA|nr:3-oxoacyl-[acyl-carrier-protein] reductase FabG [Geodia barretti]
MRLKDKVALIAGAGSNMSRATALLFAQEGAKVVLAARTTETMDETAERIRANGGDVLTHQTDLTDAAQVDALVDAAVTAFGGVDCLIHAAGGFFSTEHDITTMEPAYWDGALQNNLQTLFNPVRRLVPVLEVHGGGCLITISAGERVRQDANSAYAVAKAGMVAAAKNLAKELYAKNIRVHALCPGIIWDPLPDGEIVPAEAQLERLGNPIDVAYAGTLALLGRGGVGYRLGVDN